MAQQTLNLGIVGLGPRARYLIKLYQTHPAWNITAICDKYQRNIDLARGEMIDKTVPAYTDYEKLMAAGGLDALLIAIDPDQQVAMVCDAMRRGLHVTSEVPAAYTIDQCWDLVHTVERTGMIYQLHEQTRYWKFIRDWQEMAQNGEFGKILFMEGEYLHYESNWDLEMDTNTGELLYGSECAGRPGIVPTWRARSFRHPILYLPHEMSPLLSIANARVTHVSCIGTRPISYSDAGFRTRDLEVALMRTDKDTIIRVAAGFTTPHGSRGGTGSHWYQVKGSKATAEWCRTDTDKPKLYRATTGRWQEMDWSTEDKHADNVVRESGHGGADWWPVDSFAKAILKGKHGYMDVYTAVETAAPAVIAAKSAEMGGAMLEVPNFRSGT